MVDTIGNTEIDCVKGTGFKSIIRVCPWHVEVEDEGSGPEYPTDIDLFVAIRLIKSEGKTLADRITNVYLLIGYIDSDENELKIKEEDVFDFDTKVTQYVLDQVFTPDFIYKHGVEDIYGLEQKAINEGHKISINAVAEVPQEFIDKYDNFLGVSIGK